MIASCLSLWTFRACAEVETGQSPALLLAPALGWAVFCLPPAFLLVTDSYSQTSCFTREHFSVLLKGDLFLTEPQSSNTEQN